MSNRPAPRWQPLSMLPTIATAIDEQLVAAKEQYTNLLAARERPQVLDDATVERVIRVYTEQLEYVPLYREQLGRWRASLPPPAQTNEIARLLQQLDTHEAILRDVITIASELANGTIEAILRMGDGELGLAIFEGRLKPPSGEPHSEVLREAEQQAIAKVLDARVLSLEESGITELGLLSHMAPQMPMFYRLLEIAGEHSLTDLCRQYSGLYRWAKAMERLATGIRAGAIKVPR